MGMGMGLDPAIDIGHWALDPVVDIRHWALGIEQFIALETLNTPDIWKWKRQISIVVVLTVALIDTCVYVFASTRIP